MNVYAETGIFTPTVRFGERIFTMPEIKGIVMEAVNAHNAAEQSGGD